MFEKVFEKILAIAFAIGGFLVLYTITMQVLVDLVNLLEERKHYIYEKPSIWPIIEHIIYIGVSLYLWVLLFFALFSYLF